MANLIRSAKCGSDWTANDLAAHNSQVQFQDAPTFGVDHLPPPAIDQEVLTTEEADHMVSDRNAELVTSLILQWYPEWTQLKSPRSLTSPSRCFRTWATRDVTESLVLARAFLSSFVENGGSRRQMCLVDRHQNDILLVVQEDKRHGERPRSAEHPLVAEAIAAFDYNNRMRQLSGVPTIESKVDHARHRSHRYRPYLLQDSVTVDLVRHVAQGSYPPQATIVSAHVPVVPRPNRRYSEGMKPVDNREAILRCYGAFKGVVGI